jgi:beta-1,4-mannosyltransferase
MPSTPDTGTFARTQLQGLEHLMRLGETEVEPPVGLPLPGSGKHRSRRPAAVREPWVTISSLAVFAWAFWSATWNVLIPRRFLKFCAIGAFVFAAGTALQWYLLRWTTPSLSYAAQTAFSAEIGYVLNRMLTWGDRETKGAFWRWNAQRVVTVSLNVLGYAALVHFAGLGWLRANIIMTAVLMVVNYLLADRWSFAFRTLAASPVVAPSRELSERASALKRNREPFLQRHSVFLAILSVAVVLRAITMAAYFPAFWHTDSFGYIGGAVSKGHILAPALYLYPLPWNPSGYSLMLLWPLRVFHSVAVVAGVQAALGLLTGTLIYALLRRRFQFAGWTAALAASPVLLSATEMDLEHFILSDTLFMILVVAALVLALWYQIPPIWSCAVTGMLLAAAAVTRTEGLPIVAAFALALLVSYTTKPRRLIRVAALLITFALPMVGYATWFKDVHGSYQLDDTYGGAFTAARVEGFANCADIHPPANERWLCLSTPVSQRLTPDDYLWGDPPHFTPFARPPTGGEFSAKTSAIAEKFAIHAIEHQPLAYALSTAKMFLQTFNWNSNPYTSGQAQRWLFPAHQPETVAQLARANYGHTDVVLYQYNGGHNPDTQFRQPWADVLRIYQDFMVVPPLVLAAIMLVGLVGVCVAFHRRGGSALLPWLTGLVMLLVPAMTSSYEARYVVAAVPVLCIAAALSVREIGNRRALGHHVFVLATVALATALLLVIQRRFWPYQTHEEPGWLRWWSLGSLIWLSATVPALCELVGLLMYRYPKPLRQVRPVPQLVCWRIVSRGLNKEALRATIQRCREEMAATPLFEYVIEVVIDTSADGFPPTAWDLRYLVVPHDYQTPNGSKAKARALNYALERSPLPDTAWIVHLDEETHPTVSGIRGIARMIAEEEHSGQLRIGQGTIVYHRNWAKHPLLTLSDCIRTGSDLGRLYLSMAVGIPLFGLHGSFIVVRNDVEKQVGFDLGPRGSTTEDAWWGCLEMETGTRCRWVDGQCEEQCTESLRDFAKQRRRWFCGLVMTALACPVRPRFRVVLGLSMLAWALTPLAWIYTLAHFVLGGYVPPEVHALADLSFATYVTATFVGLRVNLNAHGVKHRERRIGWYVLWAVMMPIFSLMEAGSIGYAMLRPNLGFHVVKK